MSFVPSQPLWTTYVHFHQDPPGAFFRLRDGTLLSKSWFISSIRSLLSSIGLLQHEYAAIPMALVQQALENKCGDFAKKTPYGIKKQASLRSSFVLAVDKAAPIARPTTCHSVPAFIVHSTTTRTNQLRASSSFGRCTEDCASSTGDQASLKFNRR